MDTPTRPVISVRYIFILELSKARRGTDTRRCSSGSEKAREREKAREKERPKERGKESTDCRKATRTQLTAGKC